MPISLKQATAIVQQAKTQAEEKRQELLGNAKEEVAKVVSSAKDQIEQEKESMMKAARRELAGLVATGVSKVLKGVVDDKVDKEVIDAQLKDLS